MPQLLALLAAALYLVAAALLARRLTRSDPPARPAPLVLGAVAVSLHAAYHVAMVADSGPDLHFVASLSLVAMGMALVTTAVSFARPVEALGTVVYGIAALAALAVPFHVHGGSTAPPEWQIALHIVVALLAFAVLAIAALVAVMLAAQERALRTHQVARLLRAFPPLTLVEALLFHLIAAGFVLLTLTVLTGALFIEDWFAQHLVHKTVLTIAAWVVFGVLLFGRWRWGWRGRRAVRMALWGMALLLLGFLGSKFVREIVLQRVA